MAKNNFIFSRRGKSRFPFLPFIGWMCILLMFFRLLTHRGITLQDAFLYTGGFVLAAVLLGISFVKAGSLHTKLLHGAGCVCAALWGVVFFGLGGVELALIALFVTALSGILIVTVTARLLWIRLAAGAAGYGWQESSDRYRR